VGAVNLVDVLGSLEADPAGGFSTEVEASWNQGRTMYGGLNAALSARAARLGESDLGPLRSLQIAFIAPPIGRVRYLPSVLRRGRSVTFIGVDCVSDAELCARTILTYGRARESDMVHSRLSAPEVAPPEACPVVAFDPGTAPVFLAHMDRRFAAGSPPLSGGEPEFAMWARHRDAEGLDAESAVLAIADVLEPAVVATRPEFRPASSVSWAIDLAGVLPPADDWYLLHTTSDHAADGYSGQTMGCFRSDGRLAAAGRQTVATF
jgi:acyl-CoA thioesterase